MRAARHLRSSLLAFTLSLPCFAQTPEEVAAARQLAVEGIKLADAGDCKAAIPKLKKADELFHAPTILGRLGECHVTEGRLVLGTELLARVERETLAPGSPDAFVGAQRRAAKVRAEALPKIGKVVLRVEPAGVTGLELRIDGESMSAALVGVERPTDPGKHEIIASAPGQATTTKSFSLDPGQRLEIPIDLTAGAGGATPSAVAPTSAPGGEPTPGSPDVPSGDLGASSSPGKKPTLMWVALGVGAAGLAVGGITGMMASSKASDLDGRCLNKICPATAKDDLDGAKSLATISTVGFVVGAIGVGVGGVLFFTSKPKQPQAEGSPAARVYAGLGSVGVVGSF